MMLCQIVSTDETLIFQCFQKALQRCKNLYFDILFYTIQVCFLFQKNEDNCENENHRGILTLFLLVMQVLFLLQHNVIFPLSKSLKE